MTSCTEGGALPFILSGEADQNVEAGGFIPQTPKTGKFHLVSHMDGRPLVIAAIIRCLPRDVSRKLSQAPLRDVGIPGAMPAPVVGGGRNKENIIAGERKQVDDGSKNPFHSTAMYDAPSLAREGVSDRAKRTNG